MTSFDYRGNPISEQMTPVEMAATEDVMSELTYTPGPGTGTNHNNTTQTTPGALTREKVHELADHIANGQLEGYINQWLDTDAALRATITQQAQELEGHVARIDALRQHLSHTITERDELMAQLEARRKEGA